jgi:uncharacterized membrane protein
MRTGTVRRVADTCRVIEKSRAESFSDGVIAVAITLLALDLRVPDPPLAEGLAQMWPNYVAYVVSFLTIGIIWINHRAMLGRLRRFDHTLLVLNLLLLMTIVALPFTTSLMAAYLRGASGQKLAAAVYGGSFLLMGLVFVGMQWYALGSKQDLLDERVTEELRLTVLRRNVAGVAPYAIATAGAVVTPYLTLGVCAVMAVYYALPGTTVA